MLNVKKWLTANRGFLCFLVGMFFVRSAVADWYSIPSSSMYPTVMIGDRIITNRLAYDIKVPFTDVIVKHLAEPQRGDIVTFSSPQDGTRLIKRLVAVPGDVIEMREERLFINGSEARYVTGRGAVAEHKIPDYQGNQLVLRETVLGSERMIMVLPESSATRSFSAMTVPQGEYLMLGDNRDNSKDSRYIGFVKRELLTGKVQRVAFSLDTAHYYLPRLDRFAASLL